MSKDDSKMGPFVVGFDDDGANATMVFLRQQDDGTMFAAGELYGDPARAVFATVRDLEAQLAARDAALAEARGLVAEQVKWWRMVGNWVAVDCVDVEALSIACERSISTLRAWLAAHPYKGDRNEE